MNAKLSKFLRDVSQYQNATATPYTREFPGVAKNLLRLPVYKTRMSWRRTWDPKLKKYVQSAVKRMFHDSKEKPVLEGSEMRLVKGLLTSVPREDLVARTNPLLLKDGSARGRYRMLKKSVRRSGLPTVIKQLQQAAVNNLEATQNG